ncbi:anti-sigma factor [Streptomyces sp. NPDC051020]|uniref:anti-sigma factor n=1 Tax=Streptomyces sp. NPDC051020 TaxID=3155409 RepID=UPI0034250877
MSGSELHTLTGAYALHAMPDAERGTFERHLGACEACAVEVRELSETATRLGLAVSAAPPRELRHRVLREITTVRQESPSHGRRSRSALSVQRTGRRPEFALAASLAAAAAFGGIAVWQNQVPQDARQEAHRAQQRSDRMAQVLAAPDAKAKSGALRPAPNGPSHRAPRRLIRGRGRHGLADDRLSSDRVTDQSAGRPATNN